MKSERLTPASRRRSSTRMFAGASMAILSFAMVDAVTGQAYAQSSTPSAAPAAAPSVGEVVVTGSRIAKRDFTSTSPMVTVGSQAFENTANVAVEATLNKLPQFAPDQDLTGIQSQDVQESATHTIGISTASLRGLGANRNLVLADGQRLQPVNGALVVDLNSIPSAIIDHVEVVTGGASAVYGADAVSGVVNFILKKNYQGMDVDMQYGVTQAGDGQEFKASAIMGTNFADDRGNVTFSLEHYTRAASLEKNHSFYTNGWADPTTTTNEFFNTGSFFYGYNNPPTNAAVSAVTGAPVAVASGFNFFTLNPGNGSISVGQGGFSNNPGTLGQVYNYTGPVDGQRVAYENFVAPNGSIIQGLKTNQVDDYFITSPLTRWSMYGAAHYDITDNLTAYVRGTFVSTHTATNLFPTPFITGWTTNIPFNPLTDDPNSPGYQAPGTPGALAAKAHPVTAALATLLENQLFGVPASEWTVNLIPSANTGGWIPPRSTVDDNQVWQMTAGLQGKLPFQDWTWELYGSHGQASDYSIGNGYTSLQRFETVISSPDYGANTTFIGNQGAPNNGFGVAHAHCTSGFYGAIFQGTKPSQDCINAITATTQSRVLEEQNIVEFDTQGTLFKLPAGDLKLSLGADFRDEYVQYNPDILQSTASFIDQVAGVYPTSFENAATSAREGYGELLVPVLADLPFVKHFNLELGARYSTYTASNNLSGQHITPPGGWTYKILGDWEVTDWARFRGGYNLAVRSPNAGELFLAKQEVFGGSTAYGDPCTTRSNAPFGAGGAAIIPGEPGVDPDQTVAGAPGSVSNPYPVYNTNGINGATSAYNICRALMGSGAASYYGGNNTVQAPPAPAPFGFENQVGNQNLKAEKGHTWTAGLVLSSPWRANPWIGNLRGSVDWFDIKINGAIELQAVDEVKANCYSQTALTATDIASAVNSPACQLVTRLPGTGQEDTATVGYSNDATIWTEGLDFEVDDSWNFDDIGLHSIPGRLQVNWLLSYLFKYDSRASNTPGFDQIYHWAGTLGPSLNGIDPGSSYKYKMNTTVTYLEGPLSVSLNWRFYPHTHSAQFPLVPDQSQCDKILSCTLDTSAYHIFDLSATYTFMKNYVLRVGVDNLFDTNAPTTGASTGVHGTAPTASGYSAGGSLASDGAGFTTPSIYDTLGRRFYVGINAKF
ncbi:MAG TPA: TonB-dependent receptor [Caulobacteraceae bacterium]